MILVRTGVSMGKLGRGQERYYLRPAAGGIASRTSGFGECGRPEFRQLLRWRDPVSIAVRSRRAS